MNFPEFFAEQIKIVQDRVIKILTETPEELFHRVPENGGHALAWHGLHLAEWNRICLSPDFLGVDKEEKFAHLGWEQSEFAINVQGKTAVAEQDDKEKILEFVKTEFLRSQTNFAKLQESTLENKIYTPMGERTVLSMVTTQMRHIPYHLGQMNMVLKQLNAKHLKPNP